VSHKLLVKDQLGEREVLLIDTVAVGRDPRCDISQADPVLSRRHAEFVASGQGVIVRDLSSRNGILVNGRKMQEAVLRPGDVVQISQLAVTFLSSIDAVTIATPRPVPRSLDCDPEHEAVAVDEAKAPGEEKTSLLTPGEIEAVAQASAARDRAIGGSRTSGNGSGRAINGEGDAKHNGAWSVQVAVDDRTKLVPPQLDTVDGDVMVSHADGRADTVVPGVPVVEAGPPVVAVPTSGVQAAPSQAVSSMVGIAVPILALAVLCFAFGVSSAMIWLQPPLTARWLLIDHVPIAVLLSVVLAVAVGVVVVVAVRNATRRVEPGRETPVA
jgi:pSer/pThr/pTyr-binding forkhead associated (FHA) protein